LPVTSAGADFVRLLEQLGDRDRVMVFLIAATGLRVGELPALRWGALELQAGTRDTQAAIGLMKQPNNRIHGLTLRRRLLRPHREGRRFTGRVEGS
jgi:integrase